MRIKKFGKELSGAGAAGSSPCESVLPRGMFFFSEEEGAGLSSRVLKHEPKFAVI